MTAATITAPRVWIGSLAAYNAGRLVGEWVDATDLYDLQAAADDVLRQGGGEEIALMDREGFGDLIGEYTPLERVAELGAAIEEHGRGFLLYCSQVLSGVDGCEVADLVEQFEEADCGEWDSLEEYAADFVSECWEVPDHLARYIDYAMVSNDLDCDGYSYADGFVFRPV